MTSFPASFLRSPVSLNRSVPEAKMSNGSKKKIAVVGGGVAGLAAAWHLAQNAKDQYDVHLFEAEERLGGHAHTVTVDGVDVDIGFMVFNNDNYPNMVKWFEALQVPDENSDMSLSVSLDHGETVEWNSDGLNGLFAKRSQAWSPSFYTFVREMLRFNSESVKLLQLHRDDPRRAVTIGQYLRDHGYSETFCSYYLLPMIAAIWSMGIEEVLKFPAEPLISFFCNHKLLQIFERPQWKTVAGRSQSYTLKIKELLGANAHVASPIVSAKKQTGFGYELFTTGDKPVGIYDEVIFACHPPTAAKILETDETAAPKQLIGLLSKIEYADNAVYVHSDPNLMPKRRHAWASWNCIGDSELLSVHKINTARKGESMEGGESGFGHHLEKPKTINVDHSDGRDNGHTNGYSNGQGQIEGPLEGKDGRMKAVYVTYWLNRLQNLNTKKEIFVSLNPHEKPEPSLTHQRLILAHPQFNATTLQARKTLEEIYQGKDGLWFCGAWAGHGFHEDGCRSGFDISTRLTKVPLPWCDQSTMVSSAPDLSTVHATKDLFSSISRFYKKLTYDLPVWVCQQLVYSFLRRAIQKGQLVIKLSDGSKVSFGDGSPGVYDKSPVILRVFDPWFFVKTALEYDLGLARSYMAGYFVVEPLADAKEYHPAIRPHGYKDETTTVLGDPLGLIRFFLLVIGNRDDCSSGHVPRKAGKGRSYANVLNNASGLLFSHIGSMINYLRYKLIMDNSERGGSLKNIHAHYDLSNDLFTSFLDNETLIYSSAIYDAIEPPAGQPGLVFRGTLEEAQWRKLDTLLDRAQIKKGQTVLDIGFGWGGLSIHAAKKYGCKVTGITLSVEQKVLAEERVKKEGLDHFISFEVIDYRIFARRPENLGRFDRVLCCEMIEAVGHNHLSEYFWAVEQVLKRDGILVMEAITTPEERYETYRHSSDFINTIIFPGGCAPSLHALVDAAYKGSCLTLEHIDNIGLHYAKTLQEWRQRFNAKEDVVRSLGFDDIFLRVWNYYMTYCEAAFVSQTENCLILVFARQGCRALAPLSETRCLAQPPSLTDSEIKNWLRDEN